MKRSYSIFLIAGLVLVTTMIWYLTSYKNFKPTDLLHFGIVAVLVLFAIFVGFKKRANQKRGEPAEDELSKRILQKTAALSYYISLYIWVFILFIKDRISFNDNELIGAGVVAMAVTFGITWLFVNFRGIRNE
jgi:peptidoglycan/LPS O-acetylase OafA/YrhL